MDAFILVQMISLLEFMAHSKHMQAVFASDLHSRAFLRLPKTLGVDFRAS
jgi:hypothetical protein